MPIITLLLAAALQAAQTPAVDALFADWTLQTPGCAVGIELDGRPALERGYGMADLERGVPNTGDTIFEAGSVSKQFTAAAVLLLAREGKLSLDDPVRRYVPEVPDYGTPVTIRQMLTHTSGLRDWGSVAAIGGWPRTTRTYTHGHVLDILSRQSALNFTPGTRWSYSNSGYNLAAIIVSRVSGMSFADFTRRRIFEPLGMTRTSWRDDHTRIVPGRALAYAREGDAYHLDMPFENVHGNGGLLTTVGDLLKWSRHFREPVVGDAAFVAEQVRPGTFADGRVHDYGLGVWVRRYRGAREVRHSGSTAGYRAYFTTFPDERAAVAVLCNAGNAGAERLAYQVADLVLASRLEAVATAPGGYGLSEPERAALVGLYRHTGTGAAVRIVAEGAGVRVEGGPGLHAESGTRLVTASGQRWDFDGGGQVTRTDAFGTIESLSKVSPWSPAPDELRAYEGVYVGTDAETSFEGVRQGNALVLRQRPDREIRLTPVYEGAFRGSLGMFVCRKDGEAVRSCSISQERVWDLRLERRPH